METLRYWHNPRCSKSREGLALLASHGVTPDLEAYLAQPPSPAEVLALLGKLGGDPRQLVRFKEDEAAALGLSPIAHGRITAMALDKIRALAGVESADGPPGHLHHSVLPSPSSESSPSRPFTGRSASRDSHGGDASIL
mgnify:CR=1 FL=1